MLFLGSAGNRRAKVLREWEDGAMGFGGQTRPVGERGRPFVGEWRLFGERATSLEVTPGRRRGRERGQRG